MKKGVAKDILIVAIVLVALVVAFVLFNQQNKEEYNSQNTEEADGFITSLASSSSYVLYNIRVGEGIVHNNKQVKLINVINNKDIIVSVDGMQDTVLSGSKKLINGLEIKNNFVYPIYTTNFAKPDTWSVWINVREPAKKRLVTTGCKIELIYKYEPLPETGIGEHEEINAWYLTPVNPNAKIRVIKIKDLQKTEISTKEAWVYDLGSNRYLCSSMDVDCSRYQGGIVYTDLKDNTKKFFESLYYDGELYVNC